MKVFLLACVLALVSLASADDLKIVDDYDFHALFENVELWQSSLACLLENKPCGKLQELIDAVVIRLETECSHCDPKQLEKYHSVLKELQSKYPEDFKKIINKFSKN